MADKKNRISVGKSKTSGVQKKIRQHFGLPVGSVTVSGEPIPGGGQITTDLILPLKHQSKDDYKWEKNANIDYLISIGILAAEDVPLMTDVEEQDPEWIDAQPTDATI